MTSSPDDVSALPCVDSGTGVDDAGSSRCRTCRSTPDVASSSCPCPAYRQTALPSITQYREHRGAYFARKWHYREVENTALTAALDNHNIYMTNSCLSAIMSNLVLRDDQRHLLMLLDGTVKRFGYCNRLCRSLVCLSVTLVHSAKADGRIIWHLTGALDHSCDPK